MKRITPRIAEKMPSPCRCGATPTIGYNAEDAKADGPGVRNEEAQRDIGNFAYRHVGFRVECQCGRCGPREAFRVKAVDSWNAMMGGA